MRATIRGILLSASLAGAAACSSVEPFQQTSTTGTGGAGGSVATGGAGGQGGGALAQALAELEAKYCRPVATMLCGEAAKCHCDAIEGWFASQDACIEAGLKNCLALPGDTATFLEHGAYVVLGDLLEACIEALKPEVAGCAGFLGTVPSACTRMISSTTPLGAICGYPICASGEGYCSPMTQICTPIPAAAGEPCEGWCAGDLTCPWAVCEPVREVGESCDGPVCRGAAVCYQGVCQLLPGKGEACDGVFGCSSDLVCANGTCAEHPPTCSTDADVCGPGATCMAVSTYLCKAPTAGAACTSDYDCSSDMFCDNSACKASPASGEACGGGYRCASGLGCDLATSLCGPLPGKGEPCTWVSSGGTVGCASGLACVKGLCDAMPGQGQECSDDLRCGAGLGCDMLVDTFVCGPQRAAGEACLDHRVCAAGLFCDIMTSTCAPYLAAGQPCFDSVGCGPNATCLPSADPSLWACGPHPKSGELCYQNCPSNVPSCQDCVSGLFCGQQITPGPCAAQVCMALLPPS